MKKSVTVLSIVGLLLAIIGAVLAYLLPGVLKFYENPAAFLSIWGYVLQAFTFQNLNMGSIVFLSLIGVTIVFFVLQLILLIANRHPKALLVMFAWLLVGMIATAFSIIVFQDGFFKDYTSSAGEVIHDSGMFYFVWRLRDVGLLNVGTVILAYTPVALVLIGFVLMLIAEIQDLVLIGQEPGTPKRDYAADLDNGNKVVVVREDKASEAPSSEEIRSMLRDELAGQKAEEQRHGSGEYPHAAAEQEYADRGGHAYNAPMAPMPPMGQTPIINGPLLVQYINTYSPAGAPVSAPAPQPNPQEGKAAPAGVPLTEVQGVVENREKPLTAEEIRKLIKEELGEKKETPVIVNLPAQEKKEDSPTLTKEDISKIVADELKAALKEQEPEVKPEPETEPDVVVEPTPVASLSAEDIRLIIAEELTAAKDQADEEARKKAEEEAAAKQAEEEKKKAEKPEPSVRDVIKEELAGLLQEKKEEPKAAPAEAAKPAPVVVVVNSEKKEEAAPVNAEPAKRVVGAVNPNLPPHPKIIRIPFPTRMLSAEKALQNNYNELKSDIMAYGVKSRVSNSGDTFRLHKVTYVKLTIAGKGLKLYYALNPQDYANTTLPIQDAGHKSIYKEIPLVFKVKSDLSLRRAKQLVADVMAKGGLEQGKIEPNNWAAALKDYKDQGEDDDD